MLGISVYLSNENEEFNKNWIEKAASNGFSSIFTSLHIPEDNPESYKELLINLGNQAKIYQMDLFADISPTSLNHLGIDIQQTSQLIEWGVTGLRVDYGFGVDEIVSLSKNLKVSLNASTLTEEFLKELINKGLRTDNVDAVHNFYPRPETGLSKDYLIEKNKCFKKYHIGVTAFIVGDGKKRKPLFQGLPTLESHRKLPPIHAYFDLVKHCYVDNVYIGDPSVSEETLSKMPFLKDNIIPLRYLGENIEEFGEFHEYLIEVQLNRPDPARDVIRIENSRINLHHHHLKPINTIERKKGSITIDNSNYGRYAGEIHIALTDLSEDPKVNVIGQVIEEDIPLLKYIGGGSKILLQKVN